MMDNMSIGTTEKWHRLCRSMSWSPNIQLSRLAAVLVLGACLAWSAGETKESQDHSALVDASRGAIISLGLDPAKYDAQIVARDPHTFVRHQNGALVPESVLFRPRSTKDYPLWVSNVSRQTVEWWVENGTFGEQHSQAIAAATARAFPGVALPIQTHVLRVFELPSCLIFVFTPRMEESTPKEPGSFHASYASDTIVALSKEGLTPSRECELLVGQTVF